MTNDSQNSVATQSSFHASQESDIISPSILNEISRDCADLEDFQDLQEFPEQFGEHSDNPVNNEEGEKMFQYQMEGYNNYHANNQALMHQNLHQPNLVMALEQTQYELTQYNVQSQQVQSNFSQTQMMQIKQEFTSDRQFKISLRNPSQAKNWVYSDKLQKVFINMHQSLPIDFEWIPMLESTYIRASLIFELDEYQNDVVKMCPNHRTMGDQYPGHVLICEGQNSVHQAGPDGHFSICTEVTGVSDIKLLYKFRCKNSCSNGMNRRSTKIKFTLEDVHGNVLGCQTLLARICSCPKRDKDKEEFERDGAADLPRGKKRKSNTSAPIPPEGKKLMEYSDMKQGVQIVINVPDHETSRELLELAHSHMLGKGTRFNNLEKYEPYIKRLEKRLE